MNNDIINNELNILKTDADKYDNDITKMSDFFDTYIQQLTNDIDKETIIYNMPVVDIGIINDVICEAKACINVGYDLLPDFDKIPNDVKTKLKKGIYSIGDSKQVDGNARAVILDENGVRVKDITLKKVIKSDKSITSTRDIVNQLQMRQIYAKLNDIEELQFFQIEKTRDNTIKLPFLKARNHVLEAQNTDSDTIRNEKLKDASDKLTSAIESVYLDMKTTSESLAKTTKRPIFQNTRHTKTYMSYLIKDLQSVNKYVGMQVSIFNYLGETASAESTLLEYNQNIKNLLYDKLDNRGKSAIQLLHDYYPYNDINRNCWYDIAHNIESTIEENEMIDGKEIYLISLEDEDEK